MWIPTNPILWWTIQAIAVATLLAGLAWLTCRWRRCGPAARHALWLVVLIKLLTPPLMTWPWAAPAWFSTARVSAAPVSQRPAAPLPTVNLPERPDEIAPDPEMTFSYDAPALALTIASPASLRWTDLALRVAGGIWLAGSALLAAVQLLRIARMTARLRRSTPAGEPLCRLAREVARRIGAPYVEPRLVAGINSPLVFALFRPRLLWPATMATCSSSSRGLIAHELAHLKRRDHWVGWLELLAGVVWWWNPLFWYVRHQLRENAELACDAWVIGTIPDGRRAYAEALLAVCERMSIHAAADPMPALGVGTTGRRFLERRLSMIIRERVPFRVPRAGLAAVALIGLLSVPAWSQRAPTPDAEILVEAPAVEPKPPIPLSWALSDGRHLPPDARDVIDRHQKQAVDARQRFEEESARLRDLTTQRLQGLADAYAATGHLDNAAAIRDAIEHLSARPPQGVVTRLDRPERGAATSDYARPIRPARPTPPAAVMPPALPANEPPLEGNDPTELAKPPVPLLRVVPSLKLREPIPSTPPLAPAPAVKPPLELRYVPKASAPDPLPHAPASNTAPMQFRGQNGLTILFDVVGSDAGTIWGDGGVYTDDSPVAVAAVHAGLLRVGQRGTVAVTIAPGRESYPGSVRNGVTSSPYNVFQGSYRIRKAQFARGPAVPTATAEFRDASVGTTPAPGPGFVREARPPEAPTPSGEIIVR